MTTMTTELQVFMNEQFGELQICTINGKEYFGATSTATMLGYANPHDAIGRHCKKDGVVKHEVIDNMGRKQEINLITEGNLYRLIARSKLPSAEKFESWVFDIVLPTIRKTGGFVADPEQFINTYLPFADEPTKLLFKSTLAVITNQNGIIAKQQNDIDYKSDIIKGLVEDIPLASKRQILNRVVMKCSNFNDRWSELYKAFELKYKTRINARMEFYNKTHKSKLRSKLEYIEEIGMIDELYSIACKLYENEVNVLVEEMYRLHEIV